MAEPALDIVIPVFNEGASIAGVLRSLADHVKTPFRVLICYDRDDDDTLPALAPLEAAGMSIERVKNRGRGAFGAVVTGFAESRAPAVLVFPPTTITTRLDWTPWSRSSTRETTSCAPAGSSRVDGWSAALRSSRHRPRLGVSCCIIWRGFPPTTHPTGFDCSRGGSSRPCLSSRPKGSPTASSCSSRRTGSAGESAKCRWNGTSASPARAGSR